MIQAKIKEKTKEKIVIEVVLWLEEEDWSWNKWLFKRLNDEKEQKPN